MTAAIPWILISVLILILTLGVLLLVIVHKRKKKMPTDYYAFFTMGIVWAAVGIPLKNYALMMMGLVFMLIGWFNRESWKQNRRTWKTMEPFEQKIMIIVLIVLGVLLFLGLLVFYLVEKGMI